MLDFFSGVDSVTQFVNSKSSRRLRIHKHARIRQGAGGVKKGGITSYHSYALILFYIMTTPSGGGGGGDYDLTLIPAP